MLGKFVDWIAGDDLDPMLFVVAFGVGCLAGVILNNIRSSNALMEDIYILLHEQNRMAMASRSREYAAAAKESPDA